jgi:hypothetical protein
MRPRLRFFEKQRLRLDKIFLCKAISYGDALFNRMVVANFFMKGEQKSREFDA